MTSIESTGQNPTIAILVYWDDQDIGNRGWAAQWTNISSIAEDGEIFVDHDSGPVECESTDINAAIDAECYERTIALNHDDFEISPDRQSATWKLESDPETWSIQKGDKRCLSKPTLISGLQRTKSSRPGAINPSRSSDLENGS